DIVRKKAVMIFSRLFHDAPDTMIHLDKKFRQMLTERDPSVFNTMSFSRIYKAIIFECIRAILRLHPQTLSTIIHKSPNLNLLNVITRFLKSNNQNLKYLELTCLSEIDPMWWIKGEWWGKEQMNIIADCLEERDDTLKRKMNFNKFSKHKYCD
ncbi:hypothetical protein C2G38_2122971, partial [Gigaspora rosea]